MANKNKISQDLKMKSNLLHNLNASIELEITKITDLNIDCMEKNFNNLEFNDIINLADSNKQFYIALCRIYKKKYVNMRLVFETSLRNMGLR